MCEDGQPSIHRADNGHRRTLDRETAVLPRHGRAAREAEIGLGVPVTYDGSLLTVIPDEISLKDYGCGNASPYVRPGETMFDLGSGCGKTCDIIALCLAGGSLNLRWGVSMVACSIALSGLLPRAMRELQLRTATGSLVIFNGDGLWHAATPEKDLQPVTTLGFPAPPCA